MAVGIPRLNVGLGGLVVNHCINGFHRTPLRALGTKWAGADHPPMAGTCPCAERSPEGEAMYCSKVALHGLTKRACS